MFRAFLLCPFCSLRYEVGRLDLCGHNAVALLVHAFLRRGIRRCPFSRRLAWLVATRRVPVRVFAAPRPAPRSPAIRRRREVSNPGIQRGALCSRQTRARAEGPAPKV